METILDSARTLFLDAIVYKGELRIIIAEGFQGDAPEDLEISGSVIRNVFPLSVTEKSRRFMISFKGAVTWQVVDESYSIFDDYDTSTEPGFIRIVERSRYLDYVRQYHLWCDDLKESVRHYRIWTENEVIDVVGCEEPAIEYWQRNSSDPTDKPAR